jgi:O-succinylbenzoic acid--CoA ligase
LGSNENIRLVPGDRWLLSLPLFHVGGLGILFRCFLAGATVVIPGKNESLAEVIRTHEITHVSLVSTQLARLLGEPREEFPSLKALLLGGSAFAPRLIKQAVEQGLPIHTTYGLSEMASQVATTPAGVSPDKLYTSGKVLNYRDVMIDETGEVRVKGKTLFKGYIDGNNITLPLDEDGWFRTGDLGYFDREGYLTVTGRRDNMFISGGENIMPEEIESILCRVPGIEQVVVVPVPDETYGFRPAAFLKIKDGTGITKEGLIKYLAERLPRFKIPDVFYFWPQELESESLKIKRPDFLESIKKKENLIQLY